MPLKRALGTSLLVIVALVVPGTIVHAALGHIDWGICLALVVGGVPGARLGAALALGAKERTLRLVVGGGLLAISVAYAADQSGGDAGSLSSAATIGARHAQLPRTTPRSEPPLDPLDRLALHAPRSLRRP